MHSDLDIGYMSEECPAPLILYFLAVAKSFSCIAAFGTAIRADFFGCLKRIGATGQKKLRQIGNVTQAMPEHCGDLAGEF